MKTTRNIVLLAVIIGVSFIFGGLGSKAVAAEKKKYKPFIYACPYPDVQRFSYVMTKGFLKLVEKRSNGRIKFKYFPASKLVKAKEQLDAAAKGTIDGFATALMYHQDVVPEGGISFAPSTFKSFGDAYCYYKLPEVRRIIREGYQKAGVYYVGTACNYEETVHMNVRINKIEDFKGLKIRAGGGIMDDIVTALGASMFFCVGGEIYTAMQTGTTDGFIYPLYTLNDNKFGEVVKYTIERPWIAPCAAMSQFFSLKAWNRLTPEDQDLVQKAMDDHHAWYSLYAQASRQRDLKIVQEKFGVELIYLPEKEVEKFNKLMRATVLEEWGKSSPGSARLLEILDWYHGVSRFKYFPEKAITSPSPYLD